MYGRKILRNIILIVLVVLVVLMISVSNLSYASPNPADFDQESTANEAYGLNDIRLFSQEQQTFKIMQNIFVLAVEVINLIISVCLLFKEKFKKLKYIFIILFNFIMTAITIKYWFTINYVWNSIIFVNLIIQIAIIIYLILKIKTVINVKEGEKNVKNR